MKTTLLAATLALTLTGAAFAQATQPNQSTQQVQPHAPNPHKAAMRLGRELNLSPDQTAKLEPILANRQQRVLALRTDTTLTDAQRKKQMHTAKISARQQMANILTPDQMKQLHTLRKSHSEGQQAPTGV